MVDIPPEASVAVESTFSCQLKGNYEAPAQCTANNAQQIVFTVPADLDLIAFATVELVFNDIFNAPLTGKPTDPFGVTVFEKGSTSKLVENLQDFVLIGL